MVWIQLKRGIFNFSVFLGFCFGFETVTLRQTVLPVVSLLLECLQLDKKKAV